MEVIQSIKGRSVLLRIQGRLDSTTYTIFENQLNELLNSGINGFYIDLEKMEFVSSTGLRIFLIGLKKMNEIGGEFVLYNMTPAIMEIFEISGFTKIFKIKEHKDLSINDLP